eukprot:SAG11_NODE_7412_length_1148_cov_1.073403_2_plen_66_part_00
MELFEAVQIVEGDIECSEKEWVEAWQYLIDQGHVWRLQGWYGRRAVELIEAEICEAHKGKEEKVY